MQATELVTSLTPLVMCRNLCIDTDRHAGRQRDKAENYSGFLKIQSIIPSSLNNDSIRGIVKITSMKCAKYVLTKNYTYTELVEVAKHTVFIS